MKSRHLKASFSHAINGLYKAFQTERNIKLHCLFGLIAILIGFSFKLEIIEWLFIITAIGIVIIVELLNTAIEYTVDLVCGETYNELAKYSKDIAAGATLVASVFAVIVGGIIYIPKIWLLIL